MWLKDSLCVCSLRVPAELIRIHDAGGIRDGRTVRDETGTSGVSLLNTFLSTFAFIARLLEDLTHQDV